MYVFNIRTRDTSELVKLKFTGCAARWDNFIRSRVASKPAAYLRRGSLFILIMASRRVRHLLAYAVG